ncbi:MAG: TolC family protein, partial [Cyanobacteriota bacterium]
MSRQVPKRRRGRRAAALALALAADLSLPPSPGAGAGAGSARAGEAAGAPTAAMERRWLELDQQLRQLDRLLPLDPVPIPSDSTPLPPLPASLLAPNAPPSGALTPEAARPAPPLSLPAAGAPGQQGVRALSRADAVALALANSATVQGRRELVAAALAELRSELGTYWPRLLAGADGVVDRSGSRTTVLESSETLGFGPLYGPGGPFFSPSGGSVGLQSRSASLAAGLALRQDLLDPGRTPRV